MPIDYKNYPPNWKDEIRPAVLKAAGYKCEFCGIKQRAKGYRKANGEFVECDEFMINWAKKNNIKVITIHLAVMHMDHDVKNCSMSNLRAGCQQCHNRYDAPFRRLNRISKR